MQGSKSIVGVGIAIHQRSTRLQIKFFEYLKTRVVNFLQTGLHNSLVLILQVLNLLFFSLTPYYSEQA